MNSDTNITASFSPFLSIDELFAKTINICPNPTQGNITVSLSDSIKSIEVFDLSGKKLRSTSDKTIDISDVFSSVYLVKITTTDLKTATKRIIKK